MARLVPGYEESCKGDCGGVHPPSVAAEEEEGGCGNSQGRTGGGEMARMEQLLNQTEKAEDKNLETEVTLPVAFPHQHNADGSIKLPVRPKKEKAVQPRAKKQPPKQTMGECERCGYLSSQKVCKACVLLEGLNKNKAKVSLEDAATPVQLASNAVG